MRADTDSDDDIPIADLIIRKDNLRPKISNVQQPDLIDLDTSSNIDDLDYDSDYFPHCDIENCNNDVYSACDLCHFALCKDHFLVSCDDGHVLDIFKPTAEEVVAIRKQTQVLALNILDVNNAGFEASLQPIIIDSTRPTNPRDADAVNSCEIGVCKDEDFAACPSRMLKISMLRSPR